MEKIDRLINLNQNYQKLKRPLKAARVCEAAREIARGDFEVISYKMGILTCAVSSSGKAANLFSQSEQITLKINQKIGEKAVEKIRFKIK